jgi:hypothetical protein
LTHFDEKLSEIKKKVPLKNLVSGYFSLGNVTFEKKINLSQFFVKKIYERVKIKSEPIFFFVTR